MFYHFLENAEKEALEKSGLEMIYKSLICFLVASLKKGRIPHFFIRTVNLMEKDPLTAKEISVCVTFLQKLEKQEIQNVFCSSSKSEMMIQQFRQNHFYLHMLVTILLIIVNAVGTCAGAAAYFIIFLMVVALLICFLYSSVIYIPVLVVLYLIYKSVECYKSRQRQDH